MTPNMTTPTPNTTMDMGIRASNALKPVRLTPEQQFLTRLQLSVDLRRSGYYDYARGVAMDLLKARPQEYAVWHTLGQIWTDIGEFDSALQCHERSYELLKTHGALATHAKQFQGVALALAQARMRYGKFGEAMDLWEAGRVNVSWAPWPGSDYWSPPSSVPGIYTSSVLVQCEGGYGDLFMFMRWLPLIKQKLTVARLGLVVWPALKDFCDWATLGVDELYLVGVDKIPFGQWKYATSIMSMPAVFGVKGWGDIPESSWKGINAPEFRDDDRGPFRIGFCWRAEENSSPVRTKSLPVDVAEFIVSHLITRDCEPIDIVSLSPQRADLYNEDEFAEPRGLIREPDRMTSWHKTAQYICSMDFVLTVDTAVAHLCGLLGVPALVLLPRSSCWRWGVHTSDMPGNKGTWWYGSQLTVYRQPVPLQWDGEAIVRSVMERLNAIAG